MNTNRTEAIHFVSQRDGEAMRYNRQQGRNAMVGMLFIIATFTVGMFIGMFIGYTVVDEIIRFLTGG